MTIRGAPAIGVAGAYGMVLAVREKKPVSKEQLLALLKETKGYLDSSRPTAVNLMWATERVIHEAETFGSDDFEKQMICLAQTMADEDVQINKQMAQYGASLIPKHANVIHHCNTGALATVDIGTALGVIYGPILVSTSFLECHLQHKDIHVWVDETRPRLQGARLTAWELHQSGIPYHLMTDGASGLLMRTHKIDCVASNGDVANKIGTYNVGYY